MATSPDHPELTYIQASGYTSGRANGPPIWIVVHDMEAHETPTTAEATANYFATGAGGRSVSSHYTADNDSVVQCVRLADTAWTVGNWQGNNLGINWELAGFASQSYEEWLDDFGRAMFAKMAPIVRSDSARFGIPLARCSIEDLLHFRPGVTSHNDLRLAFGFTDHTDPGPNFPWPEFLAAMSGQAPEPIEEGQDMLMIVKGTTGYWLGDGFYHRKVDEGTAKDICATLRFFGAPNATPVEFGTLEDAAAQAIVGPTDYLAAGSGAPGGGPVDLTEEAIDAVADAVNDNAAARLVS